MTAYDATHFNPPAPVVSVTLRNPESGATVSNVELLLDTGADITLLPRRLVDALAVPTLAGQSYELIGFDGNKSLGPGGISGTDFRSAHIPRQYVLIDDEQGILGRDVINHLALVLDGPQRQWSEYSP